MTIQRPQFKFPRTERGAVLLVSLVILLVMTLLGVSTMQSTTLDMQMATNNQARQQAFQAAEAVLAIVEKKIQEDGVSATMVQDCDSESSDCYDDTCAGGFCFSGTFTGEDDQVDCKTVYVENEGDPPPEKVWRDGNLNVWGLATRHKTMHVAGLEEDNRVKYIIEFLCYTEKGDGSAFDEDNANNGAPLFRITALATSDSGKARVMLQSTYRYGS